MIVAQINAAQQQKFKVTPHDLQVLEGSEAVLRCEVSNLAGQVQWTKDGFALGKFMFIFLNLISVLFFFSFQIFACGMSYHITFTYAIIHIECETE